MAKLSAHGRTEIGTVKRLTSSKRYMSDGTILKNAGFGWKILSKVKPSSTPQEAFAKSAANQARALAENPAYAEYYNALHGMAGLSKRWKLHAAIELMPEDCDGVWSEVCDGYGDNVRADVDEVGELCRLYLAALAEKASLAA